MSGTFDNWIMLWEDLVRGMATPAHPRHFVPLNAYQIIDELIDELDYNSNRNPFVLAFFRERLKECVKDLPESVSHIRCEITLLEEELKNPRTGFLRHLLLRLRNHNNEAKAASNVMSLLDEVLQAPDWNDENEKTAQKVSKFLVIHLMRSGFSIETIRMVARRAADHRVSMTDETEFDGESPLANDGIKANEIFERWLSEPRRECRYIFAVDGVSDPQNDLTIGGVTFYSHRAKRFLTGVIPNGVSGGDIEAFPAFTRASETNATVCVNEVDPETGRRQAIKRINSALDIFLVHSSVDTSLRIFHENYIRVDVEGNWAGSGWNRMGDIDRRERWCSELNIESLLGRLGDTEFVAGADSVLTNAIDGVPTNRRLMYSLRWFRKGQEAATEEERLLAHWIALENLAHGFEREALVDKKCEKKDQVIRELSASLFACFSLTTLAKRLFWKLRHELITLRPFARSEVTLSRSLLESWQLEGPDGSVIDMNRFIASLPAIVKELPMSPLRSEVRRVHEVFTTPQAAFTELKRLREKARGDLLLVYRIRNRIVHNADYTHESVPFIAGIAHEYARVALLHVTSDMRRGKANDPLETLGRYYVSCERLLKRLQKDENTDLLAWEW